MFQVVNCVQSVLYSYIYITEAYYDVRGVMIGDVEGLVPGLYVYRETWESGCIISNCIIYYLLLQEYGDGTLVVI